MLARRSEQSSFAFLAKFRKKRAHRSEIPQKSCAFMRFFLIRAHISEISKNRVHFSEISPNMCACARIDAKIRKICAQLREIYRSFVRFVRVLTKIL